MWAPLHRVTTTFADIRYHVHSAGVTTHIRNSSSATYATKSSSYARIIEVGPRDGLQNISTQVPTATKVELIKRLAATGLTDIEATSFVSPKWIPQLADGGRVMEQVLPLSSKNSVRFSVLAPNLKGFENALNAGAREMIVFASATEAFSMKNQNFCSVEKALEGARQAGKRKQYLGPRCHVVHISQTHILDPPELKMLHLWLSSSSTWGVMR